MIDELLFAHLAADPYAVHLGVELLEVRPGYARAGLTIGRQHSNALGALHGGVVTGLVDVVHAAASNSHGTVAIALEVHAELLGTAPLGARLVCEGHELSRTRRTAVYRIEVVAEPGGTHVATCIGRVIRRDTPILAGSL